MEVWTAVTSQRHHRVISDAVTTSESKAASESCSSETVVHTDVFGPAPVHPAELLHPPSDFLYNVAALKQLLGTDDSNHSASNRINYPP